MAHAPSALPLEMETVAELKALYRASEARGARLRLMSQAGRLLALADAANLADRLAECATMLAYFLGRKSGQLHLAADGSGLPVCAPGTGQRPLGHVQIDGIAELAAIDDAEDQEAARLLLEMMGATIDRINRDTERAQLLNALRDREQRLERLVGQVLTIQEDERRRVSHELHDGVAQTATALMRMLEGQSSNSSAPIAAQERGRLSRMARELVQDLRGVIRGLRPTILDDLGLEAGLQALADALNADGYAATADIRTAGRAWSAQEETMLYRVAQEAVTNIRKHALPACHVRIALDVNTAGEAPILRVSNSGDGRNARPAMGDHQPFGIDIMRERMTALGGTLNWTMHDDGGVTVEARLKP